MEPEPKLEPWKPVGTGAFLGVTIAVGLLAMVAFRSTPDYPWFPVLDDANLMFHEAGHPIFGLFGQTLGLYGGTLGQLVFPVVCLVAFLRKREPAGVSMSAIWFFENLFNIVRYMADARSQQLPLLGGGEHDWTNIFASWHLLHRDTQIAAGLYHLGWCGILASWAWLGWKWRWR